MIGTDFLTAELARISWLEGGSDGISGAKGVCFTIRNRMRAGWFGGDWSQILTHHKDWSADTIPLPTVIPDPREPGFRTFLQDVTNIFTGRAEDTITISQDSIGGYMRVGGDMLGQNISIAPPPALYFCRLNEITSEHFLENIARKPELHKRIATVGTLTFFS